MKFRRDLGQLRDLIANIPGKQEDIVNRKMALQTTEYGHSRTGELNLVYFGIQEREFNVKWPFKVIQGHVFWGQQRGNGVLNNTI